MNKNNQKCDVIDDKIKYTPMIQQYLAIKQQYNEYLLFYRLGDFYELFFEDAKIVAPALGLILTQKVQNNAPNVPMCGVPFHAANQYIEKLIDSNYKVAICEQIETVEEAKKRGASAIVKRDVTRIITPGTVLDDHLVKSADHNLIISINMAKEVNYVAFSDISTGMFKVTYCGEAELFSLLSKLAPKEIIINENQYQIFTCHKFDEFISITSRANSCFNLNKNTRIIKEFYDLHNLDLLKNFNNDELIAIGVLLDYVNVTQKTHKPLLKLPQKIPPKNFMRLDYNSIRHLELLNDIKGDKNYSLLKVIDHTKTPAGRRLLQQSLIMPLMDKGAISNRHDVIDFILKNPNIMQFLEEELNNFPDLERVVGRISAERFIPNDFNQIKLALKLYLKLHYLISSQSRDEIPTILKNFKKLDNNIISLIEYINQAIIHEDEISADRFIQPGFDEEYKECLRLANDVDSEIKLLSEQYKKQLGFNAKIEKHQNFGLCLNVSPINGKKLLDNYEFTLRQTLVSCMRFSTNVLQQLEQNINNALTRLTIRTAQLVVEIRAYVLNFATMLQNIAYDISLLDMLYSAAVLSKNYGYIRPNFIENGSFIVKNGRHPLVESQLAKEQQFYQANDCELNADKNIALVTGPNMGGKSTYLKSNAIIAILAQIGYFVPADYLEMDIVDAIYARVGASDEIARGMSTFMVEMTETSYILNNATNKSLIIIDEIGRGTATYDGMAIAYACLEYIHYNISAKCLFATHFHELTEMTKKFEKLFNLTVKISEENDEITFHHNIIPGTADKSYGIFVAKIAGIPGLVIKKSQQILRQLEEKQLNLAIQSPPANNKDINDYVKKIDVDNITPQQALQFLYELKAKIR